MDPSRPRPKSDYQLGSKTIPGFFKLGPSGISEIGGPLTSLDKKYLYLSNAQTTSHSDACKSQRLSGI